MSVIVSCYEGDGDVLSWQIWKCLLLVVVYCRRIESVDGSVACLHLS